MLMGYPCELTFTLAIIAIAQFLSPASLHFWATVDSGHSMTTAETLLSFRIRLRNPWDNPDNKWHSVADYDLNLDWKNLGGMSHFVDWNALKPSNTKRDDDGGVSAEPDA
jgi:hypothetical protein